MCNLFRLAATTFCLISESFFSSALRCFANDTRNLVKAALRCKDGVTFSRSQSLHFCYDSVFQFNCMRANFAETQTWIFTERHADKEALRCS